IALIGQGLSVFLLFVVVFTAGFGILGGQGGNNALAATYYPTDLRSTGVGAALGVGRIGSILGPTVAEFMRPRYTTQELFLAFAVPALLSAIAVATLRVVMSPAPVPARREPAVRDRPPPRAAAPVRRQRSRGPRLRDRLASDA